MPHQSFNIPGCVWLKKQSAPLSLDAGGKERPRDEAAVLSHLRDGWGSQAGKTSFEKYWGGGELQDGRCHPYTRGGEPF